MFAALHVQDAKEPSLVLEAAAAAFSPRYERVGTDRVVMDVRGLERLVGDAEVIGRELRRYVSAGQGRAVVAVAPTRVAALLVLEAADPVLILPCEDQAATLRDVPVARLRQVEAEFQAHLGSGAVVPAASRAGSRSPGRRVRRVGRGRTGGGRNYRLAPGPDASGASHQPVPSAAVVTLPLRELLEDAIATLDRWGVRTLGELAALPAPDLFERMGRAGLALQRLARGEDARPLAPHVPEPRFEAALALEWPIEGLEPLSFVLGRLFESLSVQLERHDRGAVAVRVQLKLVTRALHVRRLVLPAPMREAKVLRTLTVLDLESHPPPAGIDGVSIDVEPAPARIVQHSLLTRPRPTPERTTTLLARLTSLMGENRCGTPALVDSHRPGAFAMRPFVADDSVVGEEGPEVDVLNEARRRRHDDEVRQPMLVLRRFRRLLPALVTLENGMPVSVSVALAGVDRARVRERSGPWRSSGEWWSGSWSCDEWDVELEDGATYRLCRSHLHGQWFVEGVWD